MKKFLFFLVFVTFHLPLSSLASLNEPAPEISPKRMPFKLGFEFQEISGLCPWALTNFSIQKKPLFRLNDKENARRLWSVVIDTNDIEFVTEPFSYKERTFLKKSIKSILSSVSLLKALLSTHETIPFALWPHTISNNFESSEVVYLEDFSSVETHPIKLPFEAWSPTFAPQVTLQHPLEYTIPLYLALFGFDSSYMMPFSASLPFVDLFKDAQKEGDFKKFNAITQAYRSKINGLVFLHALTFVQLTPLEDNSDGDCLKETLATLEGVHQVDAKLKLTLMSRRPFSSMFENLRLALNTTYSNYFLTAMQYNSKFSSFYGVPSMFARINYGEQFIDPLTKAVKSLEHLLPLFSQEFVEENREALIKLLKQGVLTTAMIRQFKEDIRAGATSPASSLYNEYFQRAISSVDSPQDRFILNNDNAEIERVPFEYDELSPPWFLDLTNSMGGFKQDIEEGEYGEAIVEVRGIKDVREWFLRKTGQGLTTIGSFLTNPEGELKTEALKLFDFLRHFGTLDDYNDIQLGMTYAVLRY